MFQFHKTLGSTPDAGIFVSGGFDRRYVCLASMFLSQPQRGTTYLADMAHARAQHCMEAHFTPINKPVRCSISFWMK